MLQMDGNSGALSPHGLPSVHLSPSTSENEMMQRKPYKGLMRSLQQVGCMHVLDMYCKGLTSWKGQFQHDPEFTKLQVWQPPTPHPHNNNNNNSKKKKYSVRWINKGMFLLFVCADLMFYLSFCAISVVNIFAVWGCLADRKLGFLFTLLGSQFSFRSKYKKWPFSWKFTQVTSFKPLLIVLIYKKKKVVGLVLNFYSWFRFYLVNLLVILGSFSKMKLVFPSLLFVFSSLLIWVFSFELYLLNQRLIMVKLSYFIMSTSMWTLFFNERLLEIIVCWLVDFEIFCFSLAGLLVVWRHCGRETLKNFIEN